MVNDMQDSTWQGKENAFIEEERILESQSTQSPWLFTGYVLTRNEEEPFFFLLGSAVLPRAGKFPVLGSWLYLIEVSVY